MKCIILAAGYATRLYPLTKDFPKPLLKVGNKAIIEWITDDLAESEKIDEFVIVTNHKFANHFEDWAKVQNEKYVNKAVFSVVDDGTETNETRLGAVVDIKYAIESKNLKEDVLVLAGDNVLDFSLRGFIDYAIEKNASCVMRHYEPEIAKLQKTGVLSLSEDNQVLEMAEKPENPASHWACPPFYCYKYADICRLEEAMKDGCKSDAPGSFVTWLCKHSTVYAYEMPGKRYDIGDLKSYEEAKETFKS